MQNEKQVFSTTWAGHPLSVEIGQIAKQANGAVVIRYGDTVVLSTAVASKQPKDVDFFPLTINYEEKMYAAGKIPGGFLKREGRPSSDATLIARLIDRPIRPLFADGFRNEVQVVSMVLSVEDDCDPAVAAMLGSSLALSISDIPFEGPIAGVKVGLVNNQLIINPNVEQLEQSQMELVVAGTKDAINMVEAGAKEVPEDKMLEAIMFGHEEIKRLIDFQQQIVEAVGKEKQEVVLYELDDTLAKEISLRAEKQLIEAIQTYDKQAREENIQSVKDEVFEEYIAKEVTEDVLKQVKQILDKIVKNEVRRLITDEKVRPDGRKPDEIRPLSSEVDLLPRVHGSALFTRGQTQALSAVTLGSISDEQIIDGIVEADNKRFMLHYNFPAFSVGEPGIARSPGRREIGHGALGERAIAQVMPSTDDFPYTVRVVSEILESNGSTSQASICAGTMALMAAGVPLKSPVAGIAMGLVKKDDNYTVLSDIQGMEDHLGDMDFKVAGTANGITALQMDIKIDGLNREILEEALTQAKAGRLHILKHMLSTIPTHRQELSKYAAKVVKIMINPDKIRDVIGPGGKQINEIIEETGVKIDIEQDGSVFIGATDQASINKAKTIIENIVRVAEVGQIYLAEVKRIEKFGAFVELFAGTDALVHISQLKQERVEKVEDVVKVGDVIKVKVTEIDQRGRVNATAKNISE